MRNAKTLACTLIVAAAACFAWRGVLGLSLYAWDTYPLIASSSADGFGAFARELMDGRFPGGHFYRPLTELSFAFDHALWGLEARGYHATDLALLALTGIAITRLAMRWLGERRALWSVVAGLAYVLHPVHFEILPLPPRRADALAVLLTLLALHAELAPRRRRWLTAIACACALAAKETGAIAPALVFALAFVRSAEPTPRARARSAWLATWPSFAFAGALLVVRTIVLGGLGGGARASVTGGVGELPHVVARYASLVLCPTPPDALDLGAWTLALAVGVAVLLFWIVARADVSSTEDSSAALTPRAAAGFLAVWLALLVLVTALAGTYRAWYALPFVAPLALLVGLATSYRYTRGAVVNVLASLSIVVLLALQGLGSGNTVRWSEVRASSSAAGTFLRDLDDRVGIARPGDTLRVSAFPDDAATTRDGQATKRTMIFAPYSLDGWAELRWPSRTLRFEVAREDTEPAHADEVLVLLEPRAAKGSTED